MWAVQRNSGQYFLLDVATGETVWTSAGRQADNAAIVKAGETLFVLEDDAELIVGQASAAGFEEVRRLQRCGYRDVGATHDLVGVHVGRYRVIYLIQGATFSPR